MARFKHFLLLHKNDNLSKHKFVYNTLPSQSSNFKTPTIPTNKDKLCKHFFFEDYSKIFFSSIFPSFIFRF